MNRGSGRRSAETAGVPDGFNEAPIHESGKSSTRTSSRRTTPRFNEAPIHESGKFESRYESLADQAASMRPRFMNRGSLHDRVHA